MHNNPHQKHHIPSLLIVICLIIFSVVCLVLRGDTTWKQTAPQANLQATPQTAEVVTPQIIESQTRLQYCGLTIATPLIQEAISFPYTLNASFDKDNTTHSGCSWTVFEGQLASVSVVDGNGKKIAKGLLKVADGVDWMSASSFNARADLQLMDKNLQLKASTNLMIVIDEENPSGNKNPKQIRIPVVVAGE